jgi:hypothetical protein
MSLSLTIGTGQTSESTLDRTPAYPAVGDWIHSKDDPGESILVYAAGDLTQPNSIRHAVSSVADVFKGTGVAPIAGQRTEGLSILTQVIETWKVSGDGITPYYLPVSAHYVLKIPVDGLVTGTVAAALLDRLIGASARSGADAVDVGLSQLLHGVTHLEAVNIEFSP